MKSVGCMGWAFVLALCVGVEPSTWAEEPSPVTTIIMIEGMHCKVCAKKVAAQLGSVPGVESVEVDVEAGTAVVVPSVERLPSPRALWRAIVKARYKPVRLDGPDGDFEEEPKL